MNKKLATMFREVERVQTQLLSKATYDDLQSLSKSTIDKPWLKQQQYTTKPELEKLLKNLHIEDLHSQIATLHQNLQKFTSEA
jgi:predicted component of type VI protein secretion system